MHIRKLTQSRPVVAQLGSDTPLMTLLGKVQAVAATVVSVADAVDSASKAE